MCLLLSHLKFQPVMRLGVYPGDKSDTDNYTNHHRQGATIKSPHMGPYQDNNQVLFSW